MRIAPISGYNTNFNGIGKIFSRKANVEGVAATLPENNNPKRKSIPIEYHNALVRLTAWRAFTLAAALFGAGGYVVSDKLADSDTQDFANTVNLADIDADGGIEMKDVTGDGTKELILKRTDGTDLILDLKNSEVLTQYTGLR